MAKHSSSFFSHLHHRELFVLAGMSLCGQFSATWGWLSFSFWWVVGLGFLAFFAWRWSGRYVAIFTTCSLLVFLIAHASVQRVLHSRFPPEHLRLLSLPQEVTIEGWLFREPERSPHRGRLYLQALRLWKDGVQSSASGKILLTVRSLSGPWRYGDEVRVTLKLRAPRNFQTPGSFNYEGYLARRDIYLTAFLWEDQGIERIGAKGNPLLHYIEQLRRNIGSFFTTHLDVQTAAVLRALILGDQEQIEKDLRQAFAQAGVTHVLSVSGLHIALVAATAYGGWWWLLGRSRLLLLSVTMPKLASILTFPPVLFYAALAGGNIATWRSVLMISVYLLARIVDCRADLYRSLALAALILSLIEPGAALDISFQLSFVSVFSIVLGTELLSAWWKKRKDSSFLSESAIQAQLVRWATTYCGVSIFVLLGVAPLTAFHFNHISFAGLVANMIVVPLLGSAAVIVGLLTVASSFLDTRIALIFLRVAEPIIQVGNAVVFWFASLPYASLQVVTPSELELVLVYALLLCLCYRPSWSPWSCRVLTTVLVIGLCADGVMWITDRYFHRTLRVSFLDVGQGDAAVVEFPDGYVMVIDGGGFASEGFDTGEAIIAPFLWSKKIAKVDVLVMSHPQLDHYGGLLYIAENFAPQELWFNGELAQGLRFAKLMKAVDQNRITLRLLCRDTSPVLSSGVSIQILHPSCSNKRLSTNNDSLVMRITYGVTDMLFTGDIEADGEAELLATATASPVEVLKVPHHGSRTSSSPAFVSVTTPAIAIASLGSDNRFHFPAQEVVSRYQQQGGQWIGTNQAGTVTVVSNGQGHRVVTTLPLSSPNKP